MNLLQRNSQVFRRRLLEINRPPVCEDFEADIITPIITSLKRIVTVLPLPPPQIIKTWFLRPCHCCSDLFLDHL